MLIDNINPLTNTRLHWMGVAWRGATNRIHYNQ